MKHIVIIGNGISGITAARHIRKRSNFRITVISSETPHFFSRTALMYVFMGHMKFQHTKPYEDSFWKKNRIELIFDHVNQVQAEKNSVQLRSGGTMTYDTLIIASGSQSNKFGWPGQDLQGVQGLYSYQDLQQLEANGAGATQAVIVGGGLIGVELAEMLTTRKIGVTFLVREPAFWSNVLPLPEANLISRHIREHHVDLRFETELKEIRGNAQGRVEAVVTQTGEVIPCQLVGLTVGVSPSISFLNDSGIETKRGVLVNQYLQTNVPNVYAIGDCVERTYSLPGRRNIEQVWYTGRMMGEVVAQTICETATRYEPGPWFNSAKFFDIEYQTYGQVGASLGVGESDFYWEHPDGKICVHVVWDTASRRFLGINAFGIRMRHACFDAWLREQQTVDEVMARLPEANFDPEFSKRHEPEIQKAFLHTQTVAL
jgi:NAD(P)H-nitrite reductase large subunit